MSRFALLAAALIGLLAASCGGGDPVGPGGEPEPRAVYTPEPGEIVLAVLDSLLLEVEVVPARPFSVVFTLGDSVVCETPEHLVIGDRVGRREYTATVRVPDGDGAIYFDDTWTVSIVSEVETPTPPPNAVQAGKGSEPGSVAVRWDRPPDRAIDVPLSGYEVAWSTAGFLPEEFELQEIEFVADNPGVIRQVGQIDGLVEEQSYFARVRSVDELGRSSEPSAQVGSVATGSFEISGRVLMLGPDGWPAPVGSAVVEAGDRDPVTTVEDGHFVLAGLPDVEPLVLRANEGSGLYTLPVRSHPLEPVDRELDLVLVPRQNVDIEREGVVTSATYREFLLQATGHGNELPPFDFHPWASYPVKVWVWEYTSPSGDQPSYHAAFERAIDLWNGGVGAPAGPGEEDRRLLSYQVAPDSLFDPTAGDPAAEGVLVRLYPEGSANLGEVQFVRPADGQLTEDDPELLKLLLRRSLPTQDVIDRVVAHELGHVLGLRHTLSETHLMHITSDRSGGVPTPEELYVARFLRHGGPHMRADWIVQE